MSCIGVNNRNIADYYMMHPSTISKTIKQQKVASTVVKKKMGRPVKLSHRNIRMFKKYILTNCFEPLYVIVNRFNITSCIKISISTAKRYMKRMKLYSFVAVQKPFVTKRNMNARIILARTHEHWTQQKWSQVMFTDESSFTVRPKKNRMQVWREKGERMCWKHIIPTFKSCYKCVSAWGGFSVSGRTPLVGTIGSFKSDRYRVIIDNHILPFMYDVYDGPARFVLQEDNCRPHRAINIATYLKNDEVTRMKCPAQSPDLNLNENIWGLMNGRLR